MPQQRRKLPFSGKKKKEQILQKRNVKGSQKYMMTGRDSQDDGETTEDTEFTARKLMEQPMSRSNASGRNKNVNRYNLQFYQESKKELEQMKLEAYTPLASIEPKQREIDAAFFAAYCDFPQRPPWDHITDKEELDRHENRYFREYVARLQKTQSDTKADHSLFELNLETWRQLWRVLEMSDILLIIVDVRYAALMFPPSLYAYIVKDLKKHAILVLNKVDLVEPEVVIAWREYFKDTYPSLPIVLFASFTNRGRKAATKSSSPGHKRSMEGVLNIFRECQRIVQTEVDLSKWEQKILEDSKAEQLGDDDQDAKEPLVTEQSASSSTTGEKHVMFRDGILTIGCVGFPNVGKSSLLNALKGRKVVSVSRTPGHTKHFQTIFLTKEVRLCDCPGLVFPSGTPKHLQVLLGSYPIAQLQVPYRSLKFLGEHLNLPQLLKLQLPEDFDEWSAAAVADAWALKRGFLTAKAARPDRYRAANHLLRLCLAGQQKLILQFYPSGFFENREKWLNHPDIAEVSKYQDVQSEDKEQNDETSSVNSDSCDSDGSSSSNDETNADEEDANDESDHRAPKTQNAFALLED